MILNNFGLGDKIEEKSFYHVKHNSGKSSFHHYTIKDDIIDSRTDIDSPDMPATSSKSDII